MGWSHSKVVLTVVGGILTVTVIAVAGVTSGSVSIQWTAVGIAMALSVGYWLLVVRAENRGLQLEEQPAVGDVLNGIVEK